MPFGKGIPAEARTASTKVQTNTTMPLQAKLLPFATTSSVRTDADTSLICAEFY